MESGKIEYLQYVLWFSCVFASFQDLVWGKIYNRFTVPLAVLGVLIMTYMFGLSGLIHSLLAMALAFILLSWMFALRVLGGGDVKYLMALAPWVGSQFILEVALVSIMIGGVMAFVSLATHGKLFVLLKKMYQLVLSLVVKELEFQPIELDSSLKIPFGVPISLAVLWVYYFDPKQSWIFLSGTH